MGISTRLIFLTAIALPQISCSVYKAATQPGPADLEGIGAGTSSTTRR